jgi:hypothetical protein
MFDYNDYLNIGDEIVLNKIASELDMMLMMNEFNMKTFDEAKSLEKIIELTYMMNKLQDLKNKAMAHNNHGVYDMCEVYMVEVERQMTKLRKIYM